MGWDVGLWVLVSPSLKRFLQLPTTFLSGPLLRGWQSSFQRKFSPLSPLIQFPALSLTSFYRISLPSCLSTWYERQWQRGELPQKNNFAACSDHCPRFSWAYCLAEWQWPRESVDRTVGGIHLDHHPLPHRQRVARWREKDLRPYATVCASASCCYTILGRGSSSSAAVVGAEEDVRVNMTPAAAAVANWVMARCAYLHI